MVGYFCEYFGFQVSLLNQERIIETIKNTIEGKLRNSNTTRIFQTQVINWLFNTVSADLFLLLSPIQFRDTYPWIVFVF